MTAINTTIKTFASAFSAHGREHSIWFYLLKTILWQYADGIFIMVDVYAYGSL